MSSTDVISFQLSGPFLMGPNQRQFVLWYAGCKVSPLLRSILMGQNRGPYNRVRTVQVIVNRSRDTLYTHNCRSHSVNGAMEIRWGLNGEEEEEAAEDFSVKVCINIMHDVWAIITREWGRGGSSAQLNSSAELRVGWPAQTIIKI